MRRNMKLKGPFLVYDREDADGHEETYVLHRGKLVHKRWRPVRGEPYSSTFGKYGTVTW